MEELPKSVSHTAGRERRPNQDGGDPANVVGTGSGEMEQSDTGLPIWWLSSAGVTLLLVGLWSYWPTLQVMVAAWRDQPDYSHGYLVLPIALFFVWARRKSFPRGFLQPSWIGLGVLGLVTAMRYAAGFYYMEPLDGWTLPLWIMGATCLVLGMECLWWAMPSIAFLWFMVPLPFGAERWLSLPLQTVATHLSTATLRILGQPAIAEGNTIWVGEHILEVEQACSGLRILVGIYALAFAFVLFSRWSWWQKLLTLIAALPIAVAANVLRIVTTGVITSHVSTEAAQRFTHDFSGLIMIPLAAALFWLFLKYLDSLFPIIQQVELGERPPPHRHI